MSTAIRWIFDEIYASVKKFVYKRQKFSKLHQKIKRIACNLSMSLNEI